MQRLQLVHGRLLLGPADDQTLLGIWLRDDVEMHMRNFLVCKCAIVL